jgi:putative flippase GtrA
MIARPKAIESLDVAGRRSLRLVELKRLFVFSATGTLNTAVCYALFAVLVQAGCHYNLALAADYALGIVLGFVLHRLSTFADRKHLHRAFGKYLVALVAMFLVNLALLDLLVALDMLGPLAAQLVAMCAATLASYALQKDWVFRVSATNRATSTADTRRKAA